MRWRECSRCQATPGFRARMRRQALRLAGVARHRAGRLAYR
jgi:hypothetical protein